MEFSSYKRDIERIFYDSLEEKGCPFYGFDKIGSSMVEVGKGRCALKDSYDSSCQREIWQNSPSWLGCSLNTKMNRIAIAMGSEDIMVFPKELSLPRMGFFGGVSLVDWLNLTIGGIY